MKVKVVTKFIDAHTGKAHRPGEILEVSEKRLAEIQKAGRFVLPAGDWKAETKADSAEETQTMKGKKG